MVAPMENLKNLQGQLDALKALYKTELPQKLKQFDEAWANLQRHNWDDEALNKLRSLAHKLAGSGATYGFVDLGQKASLLEHYLDSVADRNLRSNADHKALIEVLFEALRQAIIEPEQTVISLLQATSAHSESNPAQPEERPIFLLESSITSTHDLGVQIGNFGYTVQIFKSLCEIEAAIIYNPPAALIIDNLFPGGTPDDINQLTRLRTIPTQPIPLIFISELGDLNSRLQAVRVGSDAYFTGPVHISTLIDKLDILTAYQASEPYRILIVDDELELAEFYSLILKQAGMITEVVTNPMQIMEALADFVPDLILMDVYMPTCMGTELAEVIRQQENYVSIPIVFFSTETSIDKQLAAMHLGADDFLTKPIEADHLVSSVTARAQRSRVLRSFMIRDSLTGLLNHTNLKQSLEIEIARANRRPDSSLVFAMLDIDHFKSVNDTYGHLAGDRVIKSLARLLQQRLRKTDIIGRYGGEEFGIILLDTDGPAAEKVMNEIRQRFSQIRYYSKEVQFSATLSGGIAAFPHYSEATALNDAADKALYAAKHGGRNRVVLTTPDYN